ncbi:hypothetical protein OESDEN_17139 [Oesophagostomum dentatum]|uniref:Uncharacterized protein n=1 Tax=Oesophagostomum dentatum TaxID=61180 RepID=A0A0B1SE35_OESDE|nr:hypothetical protein OESDEN_17139 [Oesophagostomum dentatum]
MYRILLIFFFATLCSAQEEPDILSAHGGVFRALDWTNEELAEISALHTTASHHKLMQYVAKKLSRSDIDEISRRRIEKFLKLKRPPKYLETFLSESDRKQLLQYHAAGDFHKYAVLLFERIFELPKSKAIGALRYFGHNFEADTLENAECYECAVSRLAERLAR